jgi:hypothetical protein
VDVGSFRPVFHHETAGCAPVLPGGGGAGAVLDSELQCFVKYFTQSWPRRSLTLFLFLAHVRIFLLFSLYLTVLPIAHHVCLSHCVVTYHPRNLLILFSVAISKKYTSFY